MQDRYDNLSDIVDRLDDIISDYIKDKDMQDYILDLQEIKFKMQDEIEEIEPTLEAEWEEEKRYMNNEYERSVV